MPLSCHHHHLCGSRKLKQFCRPSITPVTSQKHWILSVVNGNVSDDPIIDKCIKLIGDRPCGRKGCSLNYLPHMAQFVIYGGLTKGNEVLNDMYTFRISSVEQTRFIALLYTRRSFIDILITIP